MKASKASAGFDRIRPGSQTTVIPHLTHAVAASPDAVCLPKPPLATPVRWSAQDLYLMAGTLLVLAGGFGAFFYLQPAFERLHLEHLNTFWGRVFIVTSLALTGARLCMFGYTWWLYRRYQPEATVSDDQLPFCTVIIPAYNEGHLVWHTIKSLVESHYPKSKLEMIGIDDGSRDDTWQWLKKAAEDFGDVVRICQQPHNMGKRHALYRGFCLAKGEVYVTVDSDSVVEPDTLRRLVSPLVVSSDCGAVAGSVRVLNTQGAWIPRMLNVSFAFSFDFIRSAQSVLGAVLCTPGALSAYRKEAVMHCLPEWIRQTFMGKVSDIGEDRALTNMILRQGYHVYFQRNAVVLTEIPDRYAKLCKMFLRWERSNVRETIEMSRFAFRRFRQGPCWGPRLLLFNQWLRLVTVLPFTCLMFFLAWTYPVLFFSSTLASIAVISSVPAVFYARKYQIDEALWAYTYAVFHTFCLFWITPYAMMTVSQNGWLTRGLGDKIQRPDTTTAHKIE